MRGGDFWEMGEKWGSPATERISRPRGRRENGGVDRQTPRDRAKSLRGRGGARRTVYLAGRACGGCSGILRSILTTACRGGDYPRCGKGASARPRESCPVLTQGCEEAFHYRPGSRRKNSCIGPWKDCLGRSCLGKLAPDWELHQLHKIAHNDKTGKYQTVFQ